MQPTLFSCSAGEMHALSWGEPGAPLVLAVHGGIGLAENFREMAARLSDTYHVVAIDLPGRGRSFWASDVAGTYRFAPMVQLIGEVVDRLRAQTVRWIGTSLGGALGIHAAAGLLRDRVTHLVLNDIGPTLPETLVPQLRAGFAAQPRLPSIAAFAEMMKAGLGALAAVPRDDAFWLAKAAQYARRLPEGDFTLHQDPRIAHQMEAGRPDFEQWDAFSVLSARTLAIHGGKSQILTADIVREMRTALPALEVAEYGAWGHAPFLDTAADHHLVADFLARPVIAA